MSTVFYRMDLSAHEDGLRIWTKRFMSIHETPCFHFCVSDYDFNFLSSLEEAKSKSVKIHRIHKIGSRIAFKDEQSAFENLRYRKRKQIIHLERELSFARSFLAATENITHSELPENWVVPNSQAQCLQFYRFD